jgi:hypothetical protein
MIRNRQSGATQRCETVADADLSGEVEAGDWNPGESLAADQQGNAEKGEPATEHSSRIAPRNASTAFGPGSGASVHDPSVRHESDLFATMAARLPPRHPR